MTLVERIRDPLWISLSHWLTTSSLCLPLPSVRADVCSAFIHLFHLPHSPLSLLLSYLSLSLAPSPVSGYLSLILYVLVLSLSEEQCSLSLPPSLSLAPSLSLSLWECLPPRDEGFATFQQREREKSFKDRERERETDGEGKRAVERDREEGEGEQGVGKGKRR